MSEIKGLPLLKQLIDAYGVSGNEEEIRGLILKNIKKYVDEVTVDNMGNIIAHNKGTQPALMLAAHMDEIGLMIKKIDNSGRIFCSSIGGFDPTILIGQRVHVGPKGSHLHGVITTDKISTDLELIEKPTLEDIYVDTGLNKAELSKRGIGIGCYVSLETKSGNLGSEDYIQGKALDDRIGCYILVELVKQIQHLKNELYFVFTVQEEVGLYGAKTTAYEISPDWAIAVDVTNADDRTDESSKNLGMGPTITIKDADMIANKCVNEHIVKLSNKLKIPVQLEVSDIGTTDAFNISLSKGGVPSTVVGVAIRNIHTPVGIAHKDDILNCVKLLKELIKNPPKICHI
ncbi:M28 family peptidase [Candidatus Woesearchaeota archaeon]|nr:M28 family peptidase [Candidatus Woesearchaeota archaeon]